jgi:hypothetical protein
MTGAVLCMAFYNVWSRPFMQRSSALGFLCVGMGAGAAALLAIGVLTGRIAVLASFGAPQWIAGIYLGVGGGALAFILWVLALQRTTPTLVANTMTVNPVAAGLLATQLVGEPITAQPGGRADRGLRRHLDCDRVQSRDGARAGAAITQIPKGSGVRAVGVEAHGGDAVELGLLARILLGLFAPDIRRLSATNKSCYHCL